MTTTELQREAGLFALVDADAREVEGLLIPEGELSRVAHGERPGETIPPLRFTDTSVIELPADPSVVTLNVDHDRFQPFGRATELRHVAGQGIRGRFAIARTPAGDDYLAALADPARRETMRRRLSPELDRIVRRGADGIGAALTGAALVVAGAWQSAGLFALAEPVDETPAGEVGEVDEAGALELLRAAGYTITPPAPAGDDETAGAAADEQAAAPAGTTTETTEAAPAAAADEPATPAEPEGSTDMGAATATGFAPAQPTTETPAPPAGGDAAPVRAAGLFAMIAEAHESGDMRELQALQQSQSRGMFALVDVPYETGADSLGTADVIAARDYLGELWQGNTQERRYIGLFASAPLKALHFRAWKWKVKPTVGKWSGNKTAIPSTPATVEPVTGKAQRFAGGNDLAREFYDFNDTEAIEAYVRALVESYAVVSDAYVLEVIAGAATAFELPADALPEGGVTDAMYRVVRGALRVVAAKATPTFALVSMDVFEQYVLTPKDKALEYLTSSGQLTEGDAAGIRIVPVPEWEPGRVLVGARNAAVVMELPNSPIRVNALDMAKGGVDEAVFGYVGVNVQYPAALVEVTRATGA